MLDLLIDNADVDHQHEHLGLARGAADNLVKIVDHLLDFSVIEKGNPGFDNKEFDLNRLIESLTDYCRKQFEAPPSHLHNTTYNICAVVLWADTFE